MYVKKFDNEGVLLNPITKEFPFKNNDCRPKNTKQRLKNKLLLIQHGTSFFKYRVYLQKIGNKTIEHLRLV